MVSLQEIRKQVENLKEILKDVKTIEDCRNLRHKGFTEDEIVVEVFETISPLKDAMQLYKEWDVTKVDSVCLYMNNYKNVDAFYLKLGTDYVCFDVYDNEYEGGEYPILEDVSLDDLEEEYNEAMESIMEERT